MNRKMMVVTAAVIVLLASSVAVFMTNVQENRDGGFNLLAKINMGGAGIYLDAKYDPSDFIETDADGDMVYKVDAWRGMIFGTPGTANFLHTQLEEVVTGELGLGFVEYDADEPVSDNCVYYQSDITSAKSFENPSNNHLDGGIIWEPQFQLLIGSEIRQCVPLMSTADFDNGLTCCVIGGSWGYLENHGDETIRFLMAYVKSVEWVKAAMGSKESDDYTDLVDIAKGRTGIDDDKIIEESLERVIYSYGMTSAEDSKDTPLESLKYDVETVLESLVASGGLSQTLVDGMGFEDIVEFSQRLVDDTYLKNALKGDSESYGKATIRISCIAGCIHQMALHAGVAMGFFEEMGITLDITSVTNGKIVADALLKGEADIGLMGLPPAISTTVENGLISK